MATPHVAGVASLLYSRKPSLTPAEVLSFLQSTVTAFPGGSTCNTSICGSGIVNAGAAVAAVPTSILDKKVYLPLVLNGYPPIPAAPVLNAIANADGDGNYTVSWNASANATSYLLQEDDNNAFSSPTTVYSGAGTSWNATGKAVGTYYYRVQASNTWGTSGWSNVARATRHVARLTPWGRSQYSTHGWPIIRTTSRILAAAGGAMEFYVTADRAFVDDFAININVTGCGSYKITHTMQGQSPATASVHWSVLCLRHVQLTNRGQRHDGTQQLHVSLDAALVSGGPYSWSANWMHSAQLMQADRRGETNLIESCRAGQSHSRLPASRR